MPADLVARLETRSWDRRKADPKFQKQDERIKKYAERKARHPISLNEEKFRAEFVSDEEAAEGKAEEAKKDKKKKYHERAAWEPDYYNDEVVRIVTVVRLESRSWTAARPTPSSRSATSGSRNTPSARPST